MKGETVVKSLNLALRRCLEKDKRVIIIGEDILDPYGGAFKVTQGLSTNFPDRLFTTPISEASIVGIGIGAAMRGLLPVVEIMFGDFITLAADQIINHAAKFPGMYNGKVFVPIVIRTPMGGGRAYGPTHSQSLEKIFLGIPGLRVVAISHFHNPGELLEKAILQDKMPVLFIEHKLLYPLELKCYGDDTIKVEQLESHKHFYPIVLLKNYHSDVIKPDLTILTYGGISKHLDEVLKQLKDEEIWVDVFLPSEISNRELPPELIESVKRTGRLLLIEESAGGFGWASEMVKKLAENLWSKIMLEISIIEPPDSIIPSEKTMEYEMLPNSDKIINQIMEVISR